MNELARMGGYFVDVSKTINNIFSVKIGKGFTKAKNQDDLFIIEYDNEFCTLYKVIDGEKKQQLKRDISSEIRSGLSPAEFIESIKVGLINKLCANYNIDKDYVYYE